MAHPHSPSLQLHKHVVLMASIAAIGTSHQWITSAATGTAYNVGNTTMSQKVQRGKHLFSSHATGHECEALRCHGLTWFTTRVNAVVMPFNTLPKTATARVQGALAQNIHQKRMWSLPNHLLSEYVGHSCSVQLGSNS